MITTAVVSAAGRGTRMRELTNDRPKHLIEVNGRPFISYLLGSLVEAGFKNIILVVGHRKDRFEEFLSKHDYPVIVIDQLEMADGGYGTAMPMKTAEPLVAGKQFLAVAGDHYYSPADLQRMMIEDENHYVGVAKVKNPKDYGCVKIKSANLLEEIVEKPEIPPTNLINTSLYKFTPEIFKAVSALTKSPRGEYEITDAINNLAHKDMVRIMELEKYFPDFGRPADIKKLERLLKKNNLGEIPI